MSTYHVNSSMLTRPATEQWGCDEQKNDFHLPVECTPYYNALRSCPELYFDSHGESSNKADKEDNAPKLPAMSFMLGNGHPQKKHQWRASVTFKSDNVEKSLNSKQNSMESVINKGEVTTTAASKEEYSQTTESKKAHLGMNFIERERYATVSSSR